MLVRLRNQLDYSIFNYTEVPWGSAIGKKPDAVYGNLYSAISGVHYSKGIRRS